MTWAEIKKQIGQSFHQRRAINEWCDACESPKRYKIYQFPSLDGTPWETNSKLAACILAWFRKRKSRMSEIRCVDTQSNDHFLVL